MGTPYSQDLGERVIARLAMAAARAVNAWYPSVPWGHWKTTTFVGALRVGEIAAPCVFDGPMDGPSFRAYVEQFVSRSCARAISL